MSNDAFMEDARKAAEAFKAQADRSAAEAKQAFFNAAVRLQGLISDFQRHPFTKDQIIAILETNRAELQSDLGIIKEKAKRAYVSGAIDLVFSWLTRLLGA